MASAADEEISEILIHKEKTLTEMQGITSDLPVNVSAVIDKSGNIQVEQAHLSKDPVLETQTGAPANAPTQSSPHKPPKLPRLLLCQTSLKLVKLKIEPGKRIEITQDILDSILSSTYSDQTWQAIAASVDTMIQPRIL